MKKLILSSLLVGILVVAAPVFAKEGGLTIKIISSSNLSCMQTAVEKRENAIVDAWDALHTGAQGAVEARRDDLVAAWKIEDRKTRNAAIKEAWGTYKKAHRDILKEFRGDKKDAWKTFKTDVKACKTTDSGPESESSENL